MSKLQTFDKNFINFAKKHYALIARISLFVVYFYFGLLKLIGVSPANELALGFAQHMGMGEYGQVLYLTLAVVECLIGLMILVPRLTRITVFIMLGHMLLVSAPIVLYTEAVWSSLFVPNLEGQYIIKNAALVAIALGIVAQTSPLSKPSKRT